MFISRSCLTWLIMRNGLIGVPGVITEFEISSSMDASRKLVGTVADL